MTNRRSNCGFEIFCVKNYPSSRCDDDSGILGFGFEEYSSLELYGYFASKKLPLTDQMTTGAGFMSY